MHSPVYILVLVSGLSGLWLLWDRALKGLLLDLFRERVFGQRYALFRLAMIGRMEFDSDLYRQIETLLCGLLRFGHNVTLISFFMSREERERAKLRPGFVDVSQEIAKKIAALDTETRTEVEGILDKVHRSILLYVASTSLLFLMAAAVLSVAKLVGVWRPEKAREVSEIVEREAYQAEVKRMVSLAPV